MWKIRPLDDALDKYLWAEFQKVVDKHKAKGNKFAPECVQCAEFIKRVCTFVRREKVDDPDVFLAKIYEPHLFPPIAGYRIMSLHGWCAIFRIDAALMEVETVIACRSGELPTAGLKEFIERNAIRR